MPFKKIRLLLIAFLIGLAGYFFYGWILVPNLIIPPRSIRVLPGPRSSNMETRRRIKQQSLYNAKLLSSLFPEDDWRLKKPSFVIGKNPDCRFLYDGDISLSPDHREITLLSCTVVIPSSDESLSEEERYRQAIVIETKDCLILRFRSPIEDTSSGISLDLLEEGKLSGEVNIRSEMKSSSLDDNFQINLMDLTFSREQIVTDNLVIFHYGHCQGEGTGLRVDIEIPNKPRRQDKEGEARPNDNPFADYIEKGNLFGGFSIGEIRLAKLNRLEFEMEDYLPELPKESILGEGRQAYHQDLDSGTPGEKTEKKSLVKCDLRCEDEVYFAPNLAEDPAIWWARFSGSVEVTACHDEREPDTLQCETLYFYLADRNLQKRLEEVGDSYRSKKKPTGNLSALEASQIKAIGSEGKDAVIMIAKDFLTASGNEIFCDIQNKSFSLFPLREDRPVLLEYAGTKVSSDHIDFIYDPQNYGKLVAFHQGKIESEYQNPNGEKSFFNITWQDGVKILPVADHPDVYVASFRGGVQFGWENVGNIWAEETEFWFKVPKKEESSPKEQGPISHPVSIQPRNAQFRNGVHLETVRGSGTIRDKVEIHFTQKNQKKEEIASRTAPKENVNESKKKKGDFFSGDGNLLGGEIKSMFKLEGSCLDLWAAIDEENDLTLSGLAIQENIRFVETSIEDQSEILRIEGNLVQIENPDSSRASVTLLGQPALFSGMGLNLSGYDIRVNRAANSFSVKGGGHLQFDAKKGDKNASNVSLSSHNTLSPLINSSGLTSEEPINVWWTREMEFDGQTLTFQGNDREKVLVRQGRTLEMKSPVIRLALKNRIEIADFDREGGGAKEKTSFELETSSCLGTPESPVEFYWVGNLPIQNKEAKGGVNGFFKGEVEKLKFENSSESLYAFGGGWFRGAVETPKKEMNIIQGTRGKELSVPSQSKPWTKIHLTFSKELQGNIGRQEIKVIGDIRTVLGTVDRADALVDVNDRQSFPEDAFYLTCDELGFAETPSSDTSERFFEVSATGNTRFEYQKFTGKGEALKYNNLKKTISLFGNGVSQASINYQEYPGGPVDSQHFSSLLFNLETKKIESNISGTSYRRR